MICAFGASGGDTTSSPEAPKAQIIDLLEALKRSVAQADTAKNDEVAASSPVAKGPKKAEPREEAEDKSAGKKKRKAHG